MKFNYCCLEKDCKAVGKTEVIEKPEQDQDNVELCLLCEQPMKLLGYIPYGGYAKIASSTPQQRKQILLKRSREHFASGKDNIKDRKHQLNQNFDNEAKNMLKSN